MLKFVCMRDASLLKDDYLTIYIFYSILRMNMWFNAKLICGTLQNDVC